MAKKGDFYDYSVSDNKKDALRKLEQDIEDFELEHGYIDLVGKDEKPIVVTPNTINRRSFYFSNKQVANSLGVKA